MNLSRSDSNPFRPPAEESKEARGGKLPEWVWLALSIFVLFGEILLDIFLTRGGREIHPLGEYGSVVSSWLSFVVTAFFCFLYLRKFNGNFFVKLVAVLWLVFLLGLLLLHLYAIFAPAAS